MPFHMICFGWNTLPVASYPSASAICSADQLAAGSRESSWKLHAAEPHRVPDRTMPCTVFLGIRAHALPVQRASKKPARSMPLPWNNHVGFYLPFNAVVTMSLLVAQLCTLTASSPNVA